MGVTCPTYTDFDELLVEVKPDLVIVTTMDSKHHEFIIKGLEAGCDVLTEKPLTIDEVKAQAIIDAEKKFNKNLIVGFNYRWSPYMTKVKELLHENSIGDITSVDFHWYLNNHHGASYFRRWHGNLEFGGSLWVHKATHHFDLLNWWLDSDAEEVFAYGPFRGKKCRTCSHKTECDYFWDITKSERDMKLYVENEHHDGYIGDNCVFRHDINIYDKMSAQIKYANKAVVNYYSPYEGWKIAFNGRKGRIEAWLDIPFMNNSNMSQEELHAEMDQTKTEDRMYEPLVVHKNFEDYKIIQVGSERAGHGGGDKRLHDKIFADPDASDPLKHTAGLRDGATSILVGIAARKSIESNQPIKIADLTSLIPNAGRS